MRKGLILLVLSGVLAIVPTAASALSMGPAWRQLPWSSDNGYLLGAGTGYSALMMKSDSAGFSDQTQTMVRLYGEGGKVLKGSASEIFLRLGISRLIIKGAFDFGEKADFKKDAPYVAVGTRFRFTKRPDRFDDESELPPSEQPLRACVFIMASYDGRAASTQMVRSGLDTMRVEIESLGTYSATAGVLIEKALSREWHAYAVPAATIALNRQRGKNFNSGDTVSATYASKMPAGGVIGLRYTGAFQNALVTGKLPGLTFGLEAGWLGGPAASAFLSQVY